MAEQFAQIIRISLTLFVLWWFVGNWTDARREDRQAKKGQK
jgi:hypothetical protein